MRNLHSRIFFSVPLLCSSNFITLLSSKPCGKDGYLIVYRYLFLTRYFPFGTIGTRNKHGNNQKLTFRKIRKKLTEFTLTMLPILGLLLASLFFLFRVGHRSEFLYLVSHDTAK